jgi:hypothetical protein
LLCGVENPDGEREAMTSDFIRKIIETIEADVASRPSPAEFEMAYQARVAIDRIKFAIRHADQFGSPCGTMREAGIQLLDALQRLESIDRRFQIRSQIAAPHTNGISAEVRTEPRKEFQ